MFVIMDRYGKVWDEGSAECQGEERLQEASEKVKRTSIYIY